MVVRASLVGVKGSSPREAGAMMLISPQSIWQTIGGGTLEYQVMQQARAMMGTPRPAWTRQLVKAALGPDMGQCCGGQVRVLLECYGPAELAILDGLQGAAMLAHPLSGQGAVTPANDGVPGLSADGKIFVAPVVSSLHPVFLYGAGHIGRALAPYLVALECDLHWVDVDASRFPDSLPAGARRVVASDPTAIASHAPPQAMHLVITHNHALDEAICLTILKGNAFARLGLIGSATKAARFRSRLAKAGIGPADLERLICPIGLPEITGKHPARVALSIASALAIWQQELDVRN